MAIDKHEAADAWVAHRSWLLVLAAPIGVGLALDVSGAIGGMMAPVLSLRHYGLALLLVPWFAALAVLLRRVRERRPWPDAWAAARRNELTTARLLGFAIVVLGMRAMLMTAVAYKVALPELSPFVHDRSLMLLDRTLHAGRLPHEWLAFSDGALRAFDAVYALWYGVLGAWIVWIAARPDAPDRRRALVAMALLWVGMGCVAALLGASAGPCYYALVEAGPSPYAAELERLHRMGLVAHGIQSALWRAHVAGPTDVVAGIAAFPSLHVAVPALLALSVPRLRWPLAALTGLTLLGSVALLWHYAADGYAGILGAGVCWRVAGHMSPATSGQDS